MDPHLEEIVQDIVVRIVGIPNPQFLTDMTCSSPQTIIKMTLLKKIIPPVAFIKILLTWKNYPMMHISNDLENACQWDSHHLIIHNLTSKLDG